MRNREDVDLMLDGVPYFEMKDEDVDRLLSPYGPRAEREKPPSWIRCLVCGDKVGADEQRNGICDQCRGREEEDDGPEDH